jgi:class 3 adenylate cyclase
MAETMGGAQRREFYARAERRACTPEAAVALMQASDRADLSPVLPRIQAPTLFYNFADHPAVPVGAARAAAKLIPEARVVEVEGYTATAQVLERVGLSAAVEEFVLGSAGADDQDRVLAAVLFADIVASTEQAGQLGHRSWRDLLDENENRLRRAIEASGGHLVKTTGDGVLVRFEGAARAVRCGERLIREARGTGVSLRVGIHVGECDLRGQDIAGLAVHIAARVMDAARPGEVLVTSTVREALVGTDIAFDSRGARELRGVEGTWELFAAASDRRGVLE